MVNPLRYDIDIPPGILMCSNCAGATEAANILNIIRDSEKQEIERKKVIDGASHLWYFDRDSL